MSRGTRRLKATARENQLWRNFLWRRVAADGVRAFAGKDIDFGYKQITVRDGKGQRQRVTLLRNG